MSSSSILQAPQPSGKGGAVNTGGAVGIAIGSCAAGVIFTLLGVLLYRRRQQATWSPFTSSTAGSRAVDLDVNATKV